MHKKNILFLVPDGVGIRNYLYSDIIPHLKEKSAISIWSPLPLEAFEQVEKLHQTKVAYSHLKLEVEPTLSRFLREAAIFARLKNDEPLPESVLIKAP